MSKVKIIKQNINNFRIEMSKLCAFLQKGDGSTLKVNITLNDIYKYLGTDEKTTLLTPAHGETNALGNKLTLYSKGKKEKASERKRLERTGVNTSDEPMNEFGTVLALKIIRGKVVAVAEKDMSIEEITGLGMKMMKFVRGNAQYHEIALRLKNSYVGGIEPILLEKQRKSANELAKKIGKKDLSDPNVVKTITSDPKIINSFIEMAQEITPDVVKSATVAMDPAILNAAIVAATDATKEIIKQNESESQAKDIIAELSDSQKIKKIVMESLSK